MDYIGLLFGCSKQNPDDKCPLIEVRKLTIEERLYWWESLTHLQKMLLIQHHKQCVNCLNPK